jgi:hypothetical protein
MDAPCLECGETSPRPGSWGLCPNCYGRRRYNNLPMPGEAEASLSLPDEEWLPAHGFEDALEVSNLGRVRKIAYSAMDSRGRTINYRARILTQLVREWGKYPYVTMRYRGRQRYLWVAHLVARTFLGAKPKGQVLRHLDDVKTNNTVSNLAYGTESQNAHDKVRNGNEVKSQRTHCPRNHELVEPNNTPRERREGRRSCLACARAQSHIRSTDPSQDLQKLSDQYYERIMTGKAGRWIRRLGA